MLPERLPPPKKRPPIAVFKPEPKITYNPVRSSRAMTKSTASSASIQKPQTASSGSIKKPTPRLNTNQSSQSLHGSKKNLNQDLEFKRPSFKLALPPQPMLPPKPTPMPEHQEFSNAISIKDELHRSSRDSYGTTQRPTARQ